MHSPIPNTAVFTFSVPIHRAGPIQIDGELSDWSDANLLPAIGIDGPAPYANVWAAWSPEGLWFAVRVPRTKAPRVLPKRLSEGDSFELYIDTRDIRSAHRAGRYCHKFVLAPVGGPGNARSPLFQHQEIQRALTSPPLVERSHVEIASRTSDAGYSLELYIPASALNGYDVEITRRMGLAYVLRDTERHIQAWPHSSELPIWSDTSLWSTIELVD